MLSDEQKNRISEVIKKILLSSLRKFPKVDQQNRNAPFHDIILKTFEKELQHVNISTPYLLAISSWLHGLSTSMGSSYESLVHILSGGYKRKFTAAFTLKVKVSQASTIENIIRELKAGNKVRLPNTSVENRLIFKFKSNEKEINALEFTVDNYIETKEYIEGIELKSVRPNSGEGRGEKQKILYAKAAFKKLHPTKEIKYYVGFPFDPTSNDAVSFNKERFFNYLIEFKKFFSPEEVLIASELWDHLSGHSHTMDEIFEIITKTIEKVNRR